MSNSVKTKLWKQNSEVLEKEKKEQERKERKILRGRERGGKILTEDLFAGSFGEGRGTSVVRASFFFLAVDAEGTLGRRRDFFSREKKKKKMKKKKR